MYTCRKCPSQFTQIKKRIWHLREIHALSEGMGLTNLAAQGHTAAL